MLPPLWQTIDYPVNINQIFYRQNNSTFFFLMFLLICKHGTKFFIVYWTESVKTYFILL